MNRAGVKGLTDKQKMELCEWIGAIILLDEGEWEAFAGFVPMTQELFYRCMRKCAEYNNDTAVFYLMEKYPDYLISFIQKAEKELEMLGINDNFLQGTQMQRVILRRQLMSKIRAEYGKNNFLEPKRRKRLKFKRCRMKCL